MSEKADHTRSLIESIADKIDGFFYRCLNDKDFTMVHLSSGFLATLGYDADWFISTRQSFAALTHPEDLGRVDKAVSDAIAAGTRWRIQYRLKTKAGEWRAIFETGGAHRDATTGDVAYLDGVILDLKTDSVAGSGRTQAAREIAGATGEIMKTLKTLRLLALNARLEAVRAGDHGLGFAIVAREMVELAAQSDINARVIERLIARLDDNTGLAA
jgi:PAS fold/Methyl-accepting chemotaxis protein (MCP) signalling domain